MLQNFSMFIVLAHRLTKKVGSSTSFSFEDNASTFSLSAKILKLVLNDSDSKEN